MIELRHLRYFVAVAEERHVTRAAARLGIQQPPLTQQIQALEAELGVVLLRRLPRGVEPTEAGRTLLEKARAILAQVDQGLEAVRSTARGEQGRLGVGVSSSAAFSPLIPRQIRAFRRVAPLVSIALEEGSAEELVRGLHEERLDVAFTRSAIVDSVGLTVSVLLNEAMLAVLPSGHPLGRAAGGSIALAALADDSFILYRRPGNPGLYDAIIAACNVAGSQPKIAQEALRLTSTLNFVAAGLGVSIVPESMRRLDVDGITYLGLSGCPALKAPLHLVSRAGRQPGATERFIAQVSRMTAALEVAPDGV